MSTRDFCNDQRTGKANYTGHTGLIGYISSSPGPDLIKLYTVFSRGRNDSCTTTDPFCMDKNVYDGTSMLLGYIRAPVAS